MSFANFDRTITLQINQVAIWILWFDHLAQTLRKVAGNLSKEEFLDVAQIHRFFLYTIMKYSRVPFSFPIGYSTPKWENQKLRPSSYPVPAALDYSYF